MTATRFLIALLFFVLMPTLDLRAQEPGSTPMTEKKALVVLATEDIEAFLAAIDLVRQHDGQVDFSYPPSVFEANLTPDAEWALQRSSSVLLIERGIADTTALKGLGDGVLKAARAWNYVVMKVPNPQLDNVPHDPVQERRGPHILDYLPEEMQVPPTDSKKAIGKKTGFAPTPHAPDSSQLSEFMAGEIVVSLVYVESDTLEPWERNELSLAGVIDPCPVDSLEEWSPERMAFSLQ